MHGGTPAGILHSIKFRMRAYVVESIELIFTKPSLDLISNAVPRTCEDSHCQSERNLPDLLPFRHRLMVVTNLKSKERFALVYCLYLNLSNL